MRDQARHFLQGNRLRKQSGRSREDGHTFLGFECLMRFFLAQKDMIRVARFLATWEIAVPPGADPGHDQIADQDKDHHCHDIQQFCFLCHRILECRELFLICYITVRQ
ncbi:MAG: hypothetical protein K0Q83_1145 [Deltaproteobacteria bacterium]|nr:hypothetical protein [Deltaproteobacteria bacterium]